MKYLALSYTDLAIAFVLILIPIIISWRIRLGIEKEIFIGTIRTFFQLLFVGYILKYIFNLRDWRAVMLMIFLMSAVAGRNAVKRQKYNIPLLFPQMVFAIFVGALVSMTTLQFLILRIKPWYEPQYLIPISGMMLASAMNGAALAVDRLFSEAQSRRMEIEAALALGASPLRAVLPHIREAARAAMMPTINAMMVVGVVQLPGMMTGQIIGGVAPEQSVRYQIIIMYMLAASVSIACLTILFFVYHRLFTKEEQLNLEILITR